jgi:RHS repeat-associated protein
MRCIFGIVIGFFHLLNAFADEHLSKIYLGSREGDPASIVENVSTIHGDYSEYEIDLIVPGPDSLVLSRFYTSRDSIEVITPTNLGGWRFYSQCFLTVQKDSKWKTYTTSEGKFERTHVYVGTPEGSILTYLGWQNTSNPKIISSFKIDLEERLLGVANTARETINAWTNLKNNKLYFNLQSNSFELILGDHGRRFYVKHPTLNFYILEKEVLPSGNKIFYEYDDQCRPALIKMTNGSEKTILSWITIQYDTTIHIESSDGQTVDYQLERDLSGRPLLTQVNRSNRPRIHYQYRVVGDNALLIRKDLPEGRFTEIDYYSDKVNSNKVKSVTTPEINGNATVQFVYDLQTTEIHGPQNEKTVHRFDENLQLTSIEQYLNGSVYRTQKKMWGKREDISQLLMISIEDGYGNVHYAKTFSYDDKSNILEEKEYGNLTGANPYPLAIDEDGFPETPQESHTKTYSYYTKDNVDIIDQKDAKGNGIRFCYKTGTNLLTGKFILEREERKQRWLYEYDEDAALIRVIVDDDPEMIYNVYERRITSIIPKKDLPCIGAPEVIEEKYLDTKRKKEILLKRTVNHFDLHGNIDLQTIYDANNEGRYTLRKSYNSGLLQMESDPMGNEIHYSYDENQNLITEMHTSTGTSFEYGYDLKNRCIYAAEKDANGNLFETFTSYDSSGNTLSEIDRFGNETIYHYDDLGRIQSVSYPEIRDGENSSIKPTYTYQYDLFDHPIAVTDPKGETTISSYNVHGQPTCIQYADGTQELFKYDAEGSLHRHLHKDGTIRIFEYDYLGRIDHIEHYARSNKESGQWLSSVHYSYDAFHMTSEKDEEEKTTTYTYDGSGRLVLLKKDSKKVEFIYDSLGRIRATKTWKTGNTFTLRIKEYDLLDQIIEERIEDSNGNTLLKYKYVYNNAGLLTELIGYPQNQESILKRYDYDGFGRLIKIQDAFNQSTQIVYDDRYINAWGQRVLKRTEIDPLGNLTEETFDNMGQVVKITKKNKQGQILGESEFVYDAIGNQTLNKNAVISSGEPLRTYRIEQAYSPNNRVKSKTYAAQSPDERTISFEYNAYGDLSHRQNPGFRTPITYKYYDDGKLKSISYPQEKDSNVSYELFHDRKGNITKVKFGSIYSLTHNFDPNNQLTSEEIKDEFGSYQVSYTLDGEGLIQSIRLPDDSVIEYDYEGPFVKKVSRLTKEKKELYNYRIASRDLMGNILEEILIGNAGARTQKWDQAGRKIEISTDFFQDKVPEKGYDPLQNIRKREICLNDEKHACDYNYDDLYHLVSEKGNINHGYSFDSLGNCLERDIIPYKVNDLNQVLEANGAIYTYDSNGNLSSKTIQEKTWTFQHNNFNQLISIQSPDQTTIFFTYDLNGKRLAKKTEVNGKSKVLRYFYIGQTEIGCLDENGKIIELRIPSDPNHPETVPFIAIEIKKATYVPIYDLQGNTTCLIDLYQRKIVESYQYSVFGEEQIANERGRWISDSSIGNPWRYQDRRIDKDIGLIYFGYRYYDPELGRWINPDPAEEIDGPNLYTFCRNNPLNYVDYFGLASEANNSRVDEKYFYGEYEPHCYCERHRDCKRGGDLGDFASLSGPNIATAGIGKYFQTRSMSYEVGSTDLPNVGIGFINGINNSPEESQNHALRISQYAKGAIIHGVYNATHSVPIDFLECIAGHCKIHTPPVRMLKTQWKHFITTHGPNAKFFQICHSGGAIHVYNALVSSPKVIREKIIVLAISPGAIIPSNLCFRSYNYASKRDFVPKLDVFGQMRYRNQLVLLDPHPNARKHDHGFDSPTFQDIITDRLENYLMIYGGIK